MIGHRGVEQAFAFRERQHRDLGHVLGQLVEPLAGIFQAIVMADTPVEEGLERPPVCALGVDVLVAAEDFLDVRYCEAVNIPVGIRFEQEIEAGLVVLLGLRRTG